jgi:hypothetical protein
MNDYKNDVTIWYDAFNTKDPRLVDRILSEDWDEARCVRKVVMTTACSSRARPQSRRRLGGQAITALGYF